MVLDKIPNTKIFIQRDVRETPAGSSSATALSVTDATYLTLSLHTDLTAERVLTAGGGIDFNDSGANGTLTISGEDSTAGNKGIVIVAGGEGMDVSYASGTATVSGENASTTNKGIASFDAGDFDTTAGVVTIDDSGVDHNATGNYTVTQHRVWENSIAQNIHADNYTDTGDTTYTAGEGLNLVGTVFSGENATTTNKGIASFNTNDFAVTTGAVSLDDDVVSTIDGDSGTATGSSHNIDILGGTGITTAGASNDITISLTNKTSYWSCPGINFVAGSPDVADVNMGNEGDMNDTNYPGNFQAPVFLPHGAVVTAVVVYGSDTGDTWKLVLAPVNAEDSTNTTMATAVVGTEDSSISSATIDNSTNRYCLNVASPGAGDILYGARITYTTDYD